MTSLEVEIQRYLDEPVEERVIQALRMSVQRPELAANRYWLARLVLVFWAIDIPLMAFCAPESMLGIALRQSGRPGLIFMAGLLLQCLLALYDSVANGLAPGRFRSATWVLRHRHVGFMLMASQLVICGAGLLQRLHPSAAVLTFFLFPSLFCVAVTALDLRARHKESSL